MSSISGLSSAHYSYTAAQTGATPHKAGNCQCANCKAASAASADGKTGQPGQSTTPGGKTLSADQQKQVAELKKRDAEVRAHEAAHLAAAGAFAKSGAVYDYKSGPDGRSYAVGGHVDIDTSAIPNNPRATIQKAQQVQRAALAPADPSGQDRAVASAAAAQAAKAQAEIASGSADKTSKPGKTSRGAEKYKNAASTASAPTIDVTA